MSSGDESSLRGQQDRALELLRRKDLVGAECAIAQAMAHSADDPWNHYLFGRLCDEQGRWHEALNALQIAARSLSDDYWDLHERLGRLMSAAGRWREAVEELTKAIGAARHDKPWVRQLRAQAFARLGLADEALEDMLQAHRLYAGYSFRKADQAREELVQIYRQLLEMARAAWRRGQNEQALCLLRALAAREGLANETGCLLEIQLLLAKGLHVQGQFDEAATAYQRAYGLEKERRKKREILVNLGLCHLRESRVT